MPENQLIATSIKSLPLLHKGKVRDIYEIDDKHLLIVTTDRLSAFDVVMSEPIPFKGFVLTQMAIFGLINSLLSLQIICLELPRKPS